MIILCQIWKGSLTICEIAALLLLIKGGSSASLGETRFTRQITMSQFDSRWFITFHIWGWHSPTTHFREYHLFRLFILPQSGKTPLNKILSIKRIRTIRFILLSSISLIRSWIIVVWEILPKLVILASLQIPQVRPILALIYEWFSPSSRHHLLFGWIFHTHMKFFTFI